ncbi:MAG: hypothetical protein ACXWWD_08045, partial [Chitinophagaceae bacterium]
MVLGLEECRLLLLYGCHHPCHGKVTTANELQGILHVVVSIIEPVLLSTTVSICEGQVHILPWGQVVDQPGIYRDTLTSSSGCDSLYRVVNLSMNG